MRIDLTPSMLPETGRSSGLSEQAKTETRGSISRADAGIDSAQLTTGTAALQQLKAQLAGVPDVRQEQVQALRQAVQNGTYEISPQRIANAMLADARLFG